MRDPNDGGRVGLDGVGPWHRGVRVGAAAVDAARSVAWIVGLVGLVAGLHAAGGGRLTAPPWPPSVAAWVGVHGPLVAGFALLRVIALALGWYVLVATVVAAVIRLAPRWAPARLATRVIAPGLRGLVERMIGVSLCSVLSVPVVASAAPMPPVPAVLSAAHEVVGPAVPAPEHGAVTTAVPEKLGLAAARPAADVHVVAPGDSFWRIAADVVAGPGRRAGDGEVAGYWRRLVAANRARLVDPGNPDLLFPGQQLHLPPWSPR